MLKESKKEDEIELKLHEYLMWVRNPKHLWAVLIVLGALIIRLYYFAIVKMQTLWWDEAEYLATAKLWAFGVPYAINGQRPPLFQALSTLFLKFDLGEGPIKILLVIIPSALLVGAIYYLINEMYDRRTAIIAAVLSAVSWTFVFWSVRVQPDFFSMLFQVLSILFMWRFWKGEHKENKLAVYAGVFAALGLYFKVSALLVPMSFLVFILIRERISALQNKGNYLFAFSFLATLIPYFIWSKLTFGTFTAFKQGYSHALGTTMPFGWYNINFFYTLTEGVAFWLFIFGLVLAVKFLLYLDLLIKDKKKCFDADLFGVIVLVVVSAFYIFYIRGTEDRWVFLWLPFIFAFIAKGAGFIGDKLEGVHKVVGIAMIFIIVGFIVVAQMQHVDSLIKIKKDSYMPVKESGIWLKENSAKEDKVLSLSYTQTVYYSERNVSSYSEIKNGTEFEEYLLGNKPKFMIVSIFEYHPPWVYVWVQENAQRLKPVYASFSDAEKKQANLIVYEISYS